MFSKLPSLETIAAFLFLFVIVLVELVSKKLLTMFDFFEKIGKLLGKSPIEVSKVDYILKRA